MMTEQNKQQSTGARGDRYSALQRATFHLIGRTRAYLLELEALEKELRFFRNDPRAEFLISLIQQTKNPDLRPGTAGHLEAEATKLLRILAEKSWE